MKTRSYLQFFFIILFLASCAGSIPAANPTATPVPTPTSQPIPTQTSIPLPIPSPTVDCRKSGGQVIHDQMQSLNLKRALLFDVYLPPCYSTASSGFPVVYLLHGQNSDQTQWQRLGAGLEADKLIAGNPNQVPFLLVMPYEQDNLIQPYDSHFGDALSSELVPYIDSKYHTCNQFSCRAIAGISRGAAWAVWLGLNRPGVFSLIGAHSFPPFIGDLYRLPTWLRAIPADQMPYIFMDSGQADPWLPDTRRFEKVLSDFSVPHTFVINPGDHTENYWQSHLPEYIQQLASRLSPGK